MSGNNTSRGTAPRVAIVTSDEAALVAVQECLRSSFQIGQVSNCERLLPLLQETSVEAIVLDLDSAGGSGEQLARIDEIRQSDKDAMILALSRSRSKALRRDALEAGVDEFLVVPSTRSELQKQLQDALERRHEHAENRRLREQALSRYTFCGLIGASEPMRLVYDAVTRVADGNTTVIIRGESGTGKELVAHAIVANSPRSGKAFVSVNCAALPETLIESELFGHEKGSFTGAYGARPGQIELAHGGTLFLDEIGTLDLALQSKLLRVLEQHTVQRIGSNVPKKIDFRLITATNEDLEEAVHAGRFREDLYYRIHVVPIFLHPLREREGDIPLLVDHFLHLYCGANRLPLKQVDADVLEMLEDYPWPGNVRELENVVQRLVLMAPGEVITAKHLPRQILYTSTTRQESLLIPEEGISFDEEMDRIEVAYLQAALRRSEGKKVAAAALLHINPQKMKYLCRKHRLQG